MHQAFATPPIILACAKSKKDLFLSKPNLCKKCSPAILKTIIWLLKKSFSCLSQGNNKVLSEDCFGFNAKDLVKSGIYKSSNAAFTEAKVALDILSTIRFVSPVGENDTVNLESMRNEPSLFTKVEVTRGFFVIYLNPDFPWAMLKKPFTLIPTSIYSLSKYAVRILWYICYLARQNDECIMQDKEFIIRLNTLAIRLGIKLPKETANPKRDIWKVIEGATREINKNVSSLGIQLRIDANPDVSITETLLSGKLYVRVSGFYKENIAQLHNTKKEKQKNKWKNNKTAKEETKSRADESSAFNQENSSAESK